MEEITSIGPLAVSFLAAAIPIRDTDRRLVFGALALLGADSHAALPALIEHLQEARTGGNSADVYRAIEAIGAIGPTASQAVPILLGFVEHEGISRWELYKALGRIGPAAASAVPLLLEALSLETSDRLGAAMALESIEPGRKELIPALVASLKDRDHSVRREAANLLGKRGAGARNAVPALLDAMGDGEDTVAAAAAAALDRIDPAVGMASSLRMARNRTRRIRTAGLVALGSFRSRAAEVVPILLEATEDDSDETVRAAIASLGRLGGDAAAAVPRLVEICRAAGSRDLTLCAAESLGNIGVASPEVLTALEDLLPTFPELRVTTAFVRLAAGSKTEAVVERLIRVLGRDGAARSDAIEALSRIGPAAAAAMPALMQIAADRSDPEPGHAAEALGRIRGP